MTSSQDMSPSIPEKLFPILEEGKWGYIDQKGTVVIEPQFEDALGFSEGMAAVSQGGLYGFIDTKGSMVIPPQFDYAHPVDGFSEGLAAVGTYTDKGKTQGRWNYIDTKGNVVFKNSFLEAWKFSEGWALVDLRESPTTLRQYTYINNKGEYLTQERYLTAQSFAEGLAAAQDPHTNLFGFLDKTGAWYIQPEFKSAESFSEGVAGISDQNDNVHFIDRNKKILCSFPMPYLSFFPCKDGLIPFPSKEDSFKKGYMDTEGNVVIEPQYGFGAPFSEGRCVITQQEVHYGFMDMAGNIIIKPIFDYAEAFSGGLAKVMPDAQTEIFGYLDKEGNWIWQPTQKFAEQFQHPKNHEE